MSEQQERNNFLCRPLKYWETALIFCGALAVMVLLTPWDECNKDQQNIMLALLTALFTLAIAIAYKLAQGRYDIAILLGMVAAIAVFLYMVVCGPSLHQIIQQSYSMKYEDTTANFASLNVIIRI